MKELPKAYDASKEREIYSRWEERKLFNPDKMCEYLKENGYEIKKPFTITLPPPNANGDLHLGHMCGYSFHDVMGRYMRMTGHPTLLLPGKDHAGIQTETAFSKKLEKDGTTKWELGREEFYKQCYEFTMKNAQNAREQEKNIGLSADYSRELFTLDPKLTEIVYETFYKMYEERLVYRDKRIINQCPECRTALADIDTEHEERRGIFAYIRYPFVEEDGYITVATTRPETMLGDTAVAVHPEDARYKEYIGKKVLLPIANREIPIIADKDVDMEKGTGAVKVTPAHSPIDFDLGQKHDLEIINVIDEEGKMTGDIPKRFIGLNTIDCSKKLCSELEKEGLLEKIENMKHEVTVCERCRTAIQPIISNQWYIDVSQLAKRALEELKKGNVKVLPEGQQRALEHFYENIQPWCISRQLWWGQRIPIWYKGGKKKYDEEGTEIHLGENPPDDSGEWEPETDMFDTWFSSGQWPYSTLGGPGSEDYSKYYPTQLMIHARDILFWWSARMIMMGLYRTNQVPYPQIFLTGMILAEDGSKMSKSKGNGVEPTEVFDRYGADALRLWYYSDALPGSNAPLREEKIKGNRNFVNKIWNASRFIVMNIDESEIDDIVKCEVDNNLERVKATKEHIKRVGEYIERYQFNLGAELIREFFWHTLCDVWIEEVKNEIQDEDIGSDIRVKRLAELLFVLKENLKIMHPFIPFVTEAVWQELVKLGLAKDTLMEQQIEI
jgi:valyl-tRNA synthetase